MTQSPWSRTSALVLAVAAVLAGSLRGAPLDDALDATVFIQMAGLRGKGTGSGFVVSQDATSLYIVTNHHVATMGTGNTSVLCTAVFRSGTKREKSMPLELLALDPLHDLALFRTSKIRNPPKPLTLDRIATPKVTEQVTVIGFPFGKTLDLDNKNPAVTVTRANVSQPYHNRFGVMQSIELTGSANPGNSGGPVVNAEGRLVGVLVAKYNVGKAIRAIPAEHVRNLWEGVYLLDDIVLYSGYGLSCMLTLSVLPVDPFDKAKSTRLVIMPASGVSPEMDLATFHRLAATHRAISVKKQRLSPGRAGSVPVALTVPEDAQPTFAAALQVTREDGSIWLGPPEFFRLKDVAKPVPLTVDFTEADRLLEGLKARKEPEGKDGEPARPVPPALVEELFADDGLRILRPTLTVEPWTEPCWLDGGETALVLAPKGWLLKVALPSFATLAAQRLPWGMPEIATPGVKGSPPIPHATIVRNRRWCFVLIGRSAGVFVIDPATLGIRAFFPVLGVVALSAVPESDRVLARYATGELGLLDPDSGAIRLLCRGRTSAVLRVTGEADSLPSLPVDTLVDARLLPPGDRVLVLGDRTAYVLGLRDGAIRPPGRRTPTWKDCNAISYQPGHNAFYLAPEPPDGAGVPRLVDLRRLRATKLPAGGSAACFDPVARQVLDLHGPTSEIRRFPMKGGEAKIHPWPLRTRLPAGQPLVAHPRGNCYWLNAGGTVLWLEFGEPWAKPPPTAGPPAPTPTPILAARALGKVYDLPQISDRQGRELNLPAKDAIGLCWTGGANSFLVAWQAGVIRRIGVRDLAVERTTDLKRTCIALARSGLGPVATLSGGTGTQLAILNDLSLAPSGTVDLPERTLVAVGERTSLALAAIPDRGIQLLTLPGGNRLGSLTRFPLPGGKGKRAMQSVDALALSADGTRGYAAADGYLVCLRVAKGKLTVDGVFGKITGPAPHANALSAVVNDLALSADGLLLELAAKDQRRGPHHEIRSAADPNTLYSRVPWNSAVGFDCAARRLLCSRNSAPDSYPFPKPPRSTVKRHSARPHGLPYRDRLLPHPEGNRIVVLGERIQVFDYTWEIVP